MGELELFKLFVNLGAAGAVVIVVFLFLKHGKELINRFMETIDKLREDAKSQQTQFREAVESVAKAHGESMKIVADSASENARVHTEASSEICREMSRLGEQMTDLRVHCGKRNGAGPKKVRLRSKET